METNGQKTSESNVSISDLSSHVVQLARMIDRLTPGTYEITLQKQDLRQQDWSVEIVRTEQIIGTQLKYVAE
jgi:hypothetical protein